MSTEDKTAALSPADRGLLERRNRVLGAAYRLFYQRPLNVVRGDGVWLFDAEGRRYLDAYNNVASLGHSRPEVVEAIAKQSSLLNTHTRYLNDVVIAYAESLLREFPAELDNVMFTCTGSEANDLALRIARTVTGGQGLIVTQFAYHGVTAAMAEASPSLGRENPLGSTVFTVPAPLSPKSVADVEAHFAEGVGRAIRRMKTAGIQPAALLVDTIFSSDGVYAAPAGFLKPAVELIRKAGGLFIADEVQAGFGRTGAAMWGFARHELVPDLVTLGKPMGNGHPVAAVVAQRRHVDTFGRLVRYFNTFGGNPVSCAAGAAVLEVIRKERLVANSRELGQWLRGGLASIGQRHELIDEVRGEGLFLGISLTRDSAPATEDASRVVNRMRDLGVLVSATGPGVNVLKIRPPLVLEREQASMLLEILDTALQAN